MEEESRNKSVTAAAAVVDSSAGPINNEKLLAARARSKMKSKAMFQRHKGINNNNKMQSPETEIPVEPAAATTTTTTKAAALNKDAGVSEQSSAAPIIPKQLNANEQREAETVDPASLIEKPTNNPASQQPATTTTTTISEHGPSNNNTSPVRFPRRAANSPQRKRDLVTRIFHKKTTNLKAPPARPVEMQTEEDQTETEEQQNAITAIEMVVDDDDTMDDPQREEETVVRDYYLENNVANQNHPDPELEDIQSEVSVATSTGFDMRSILDYPPSPPPQEEDDEEAGDRDRDPSWDASSPVFEEQNKKDNKKAATAKDDGLDMFETDSWAVTNTTDFSATMPGMNADIEGFADRLMEEEKKSSDTDDNFARVVAAQPAPPVVPLPVLVVEEEQQLLAVVEEEQQQQDLTWDISNPIFLQKVEEMKQKHADSFNMFETGSWGGTDAGFSEVSLSRFAQNADIESEFVRLMLEDLEKRKAEAAGQVVETTKPVKANGKDTTSAPQEEDGNYAQEERKKRIDELDDDEPLLIPVPSSSAGSGDGDDMDYSIDDSGENAISMAERVQMYTAPPTSGDDSSAADEDEEADDDDDESFDEGDGAVEYVGQGSDDEDDNNVHVDFIPDSEEAPVAPDTIPTFDAAAAAAHVSERTEPNVGFEMGQEAISAAATAAVPKVELENLDIMNSSGAGSVSSSLMGDIFLSTESVSGSSLHSGVTNTSASSNKRSPADQGIPPRQSVPLSGTSPPPPPPPGGKKVKGRRRAKPGDNKNSGGFLLIPPPPAEKLKKWEDSKMRGQRHLESFKATRLEDVQEDADSPGRSHPNKPAKSPVDAARALVIQNALHRADKSNEENDKEQDGDFFGLPEAAMEGFEVTREGFAREEPQGLFTTSKATSKVRQPKHSGDKTRSPTHGSSILTDQNLAEKVAKAEAAAAVKFEQCLADVDGNPAPTEGEENDDVDQESKVGSPSKTDPTEKLHDTGMDLVGGAFKAWKYPEFESTHKVGNASRRPDEAIGEESENGPLDRAAIFSWLCAEVLGLVVAPLTAEEEASCFPDHVRTLLEDDDNFNTLCQYMADCVNKTTDDYCEASTNEDLRAASMEESLQIPGSSLEDTADALLEERRPRIKPMVLSKDSKHLATTLLAANFVSFLYLPSKLAKVRSPFGDNNPFLLDIITLSLKRAEARDDKDDSEKRPKTVQQLVFDHPHGRPDLIAAFVYKVCRASEAQLASTKGEEEAKLTDYSEGVGEFSSAVKDDTAQNTGRKRSRLLVVPEERPSPFEASIWNVPRILAAVLSFLGDPVAVCRMKMVNRFCRRLIAENEHMIMKDAVRVGGLSMNVRPAFWMWITLQKCARGSDENAENDNHEHELDLSDLERMGREGKWHSVIQRDVSRAFGNMPPHKTGARLRTDSIVRALVTWGRNRIMTRGVKGGGDVVPTPNIARDGRSQKEKPRPGTSPPPWEQGEENESIKSELSQCPTDTVSDWGGVSPVGSFAGSQSGFNDETYGRLARQSSRQGAIPAEDLALSGNALTDDMKVDMQNKLGFILHALSAAHEDVGYCQGMDYVVAHLLRIMQDTVRWKAVKGNLPNTIKAASNLPELTQLNTETPQKIYDEVDKCCLVEEAVFRVMDTFFTSYNLRHMYWPELRCLKLCCRVFERLIQIKLPVLADHFEHHDLNVGLFALGWFQTLFLYLPSMPSATVNHMWDIWLVERSFKIFFRVGTAILFLSQPILLNHELEGMMIYLNTFPDATLLNPDILIACALNIKVTNRMLAELEAEVSGY
jgi:hypothetical protein